MYSRVGKEHRAPGGVTRRAILQAGLTAGLGLGGRLLTDGLTASPVEAAPQPVYGGQVTVMNYGYPEVWDPHLAGTLGASGSISPMYNQVVEYNPLNPSEVIGDLAKSWEVSDGGTTYTFRLHEHVTWWDGKPLTAEDVVFSINRMIEEGKPRPRVGLLRPSVKAVELVDRYTVRVFLKLPSPSFLQFLAVDYMKVLPKHVVEAGTDINNWQNIVGSGPFKIKQARRGDSVTFEKNKDYFKKGQPYLDGLRTIVITDQGTAAAAIKSGQIHATTAVSGLQVDDVLKLEKDLKGRYTVYWQPANNVEHFFGNTEREPWKDTRIIKALRLATDLREIQKAFGSGYYDIGAPFPPGKWYASSAEEVLTHPGYRSPKEPDIAEALTILKAAGYDPPSKLGKRVLTVPTVLYWPDVAQLWTAQMRRNLGLEIEIKLVDVPTAVNTWVSGDFDLGSWGYGYNITDPDDYVNAIYGPESRNYTRWKHPKFLAMLKVQLSELDREKRLQTLRAMEQMLLEESPYVELFWARRNYVISDKIRTMAGAFVPSETIQTVLKWEHIWLEK
jgi:peptide/nickel transport system substrate-binding protein